MTIKVGSSVRLAGVKIDDKGTDAKGKVLQVDKDGLAIVDIGIKVVAILTKYLTKI